MKKRKGNSVESIEEKQKRENLFILAQAGTCVLPVKAVQKRKKDFSKKKQAGEKREKRNVKDV